MALQLILPLHFNEPMGTKIKIEDRQTIPFESYFLPTVSSAVTVSFRDCVSLWGTYYFDTDFDSHPHIIIKRIKKNLPC